jgi:hypothetical protein
MVNATQPIPTITQLGNILFSSPAASYQWQLNTVDIPGATNQVYEVLQTGYYTVMVSDANGCENSATLYVEITGIENLFSDQSISVFPNPAYDAFTLLLNSTTEENREAKIEVLNLLGQIIFSENGKVENGKLFREIQLNDAAEGMYLVKVTIDDHMYTVQINKESH